MPNYYVHLDGQVQGPYNEQELKARAVSGVLTGDCPVSVDGGAWQSYGEVFPSHDAMTVNSPPTFAARLLRFGIGRIPFLLFLLVGPSIYFLFRSLFVGGRPLGSSELIGLGLISVILILLRLRSMDWPIWIAAVVFIPVLGQMALLALIIIGAFVPPHHQK